MDVIAFLLVLFVGLWFFISVATGDFQRLQKRQEDKTEWMTYLGCFMGVPEDPSQIMKDFIRNNSPGLCSGNCQNWKYYALQNHWCFNDGVFNSLSELRRNMCYDRCSIYSPKTYCGSKEKIFVSVYRRESDLNGNYTGEQQDCIAGFPNKTRQATCHKELSFVCNGNDFRVEDVKLRFYEAKLFCENKGSRLLNMDELPKSLPSHFPLWVGTFRQSRNAISEASSKAKLNTASSNAKSTTGSSKEKPTAASSKAKPTSASSKAKSTLSSSQTTTSTAATLSSVLTTLFTVVSSMNSEKKHYERTNSKPFIDEKRSEGEIRCGTYCFVLGLILGCIAILAFMVCLFKVRHEWNIRFQKNTTVTIPVGIESNEQMPVYLDPARQTALFRNTHLDTVNQQIYDETGGYAKASTAPSRDACVSGYQELNFKLPTPGSETKIEVTCADTAKYNKPWDLSNISKEMEGIPKPKEGRKTPFHASLRSAMFHNRHRQSQLQYEETTIDHKKYLYDDPQRSLKMKHKSAPMQKRKEEQDQINSDERSSTTSKINTMFSKMMSSFKNPTSNPPDIIMHDSPQNNENDHTIYAVPDPKSNQTGENVEKGKLFELGKTLKLKVQSIPMSFRRPKRRTTTNADDIYTVPNAVSASDRSSRCRSEAAAQKILIPGQNVLRKFTNYEVAQPINSTQTKRGVSTASGFKYDVAMALDDTSDDRHSRGSFQYDVANRISSNAGNVDDVSKSGNPIPIYFEPEI